MNVVLRLLTGTEPEMAALQRVLEDAPAYSERVTGHPPGPADAQSTFSVLPDGMDYRSKFVWGVLLDGADSGWVGALDVIRGWPDPTTALLGLLLIAEPHQGRGLGRAAYEAVEAEIRGWPEIDRVRVAVVETNADTLPFWSRMGFTETGKTRPYAYDKLRSRSIILTTSLHRVRCRALRGDAQPAGSTGGWGTQHRERVAGPRSP